MKPDGESISEAESHALREGRSGPTAPDLWPQVEDQGAAYQNEGKARRDERNQHGGREARKDNE